MREYMGWIFAFNFFLMWIYTAYRLNNIRKAISNLEALEILSDLKRALEEKSKNKSSN